MEKVKAVFKAIGFLLTHPVESCKEILKLSDKNNGGGYNYLPLNRTICCGKLYKDVQMKKPIMLNHITSMSGSSLAITDYMLLRALVVKYDLKVYLEIGSYIGESISNVSDCCNVCYSITAPLDAPYSMKSFCEKRGMVDFSNRLISGENIKQFLCDSQKFDYSQITDKVDIYFVDGDHSYEGVLHDTRKVFEHREKESFVVWHDFKATSSGIEPYGETAKAVREVLGDKEWENVYMFDNSVCGIYIPQKYQDDFRKYINYNRNILYTYRLEINVQEIE